MSNPSTKNVIVKLGQISLPAEFRQEFAGVQDPEIAKFLAELALETATPSSTTSNATSLPADNKEILITAVKELFQRNTARISFDVLSDILDESAIDQCLNITAGEDSAAAKFSVGPQRASQSNDIYSSMISLMKRNDLKPTSHPSVFLLNADYFDEKNFINLLSELNRFRLHSIRACLNEWLASPLTLTVSKDILCDPSSHYATQQVFSSNGVLNGISELAYSSFDPVLVIDNNYHCYCLMPHQISVEGPERFIQILSLAIDNFNNQCFENDLASNEYKALESFLCSPRDFESLQITQLPEELAEAATKVKDLVFVCKNLIKLSLKAARQDWDDAGDYYTNGPNFREVTKSSYDSSSLSHKRAEVCSLFERLYREIETNTPEHQHPEILNKIVTQFKRELKSLNGDPTKPQFVTSVCAAGLDEYTPFIAIGVVASFYQDLNLEDDYDDEDFDDDDDDSYLSAQELDDMEVEDRPAPEFSILNDTALEDSEDSPTTINKDVAVENWMVAITTPLKGFARKPELARRRAEKYASQLESIFKAALEERFVKNAGSQTESDFIKIITELYPKLTKLFLSGKTSVSKIFSQDELGFNGDPLRAMLTILDVFENTHKMFELNNKQLQWFKVLLKYYADCKKEVGLNLFADNLSMLEDIQELSTHNPNITPQYVNIGEKRISTIFANCTNDLINPEVLFLCSMLTPLGHKNVAVLLDGDFYIDEISSEMITFLNSLEAGGLNEGIPDSSDHYEIFLKYQRIFNADKAILSSEIDWKHLNEIYKELGNDRSF